MSLIHPVFFAYIGTQEIMIIAGVIVVMFGGSKIPELMKGMGQGMREFKNSMEGSDEPHPAADETKAGADKRPVPPSPPVSSSARPDTGDRGKEADTAEDVGS